MYLTAGNFPSIAANAIQVAKMSAAYAEFLPSLEVIALSGPWALWRRPRTDINELFGLSIPIRVRYLPMLLNQREELFDENYRPPKWFPTLVGRYARLRRAGLVFTRKDATALETIRGSIPTVLETHLPWEQSPLLQDNFDLLKSPSLKAVVVITPSLAESFAKAGIPQDRIIMQPDGVDLEQFEPELTKARARKALGIQGNGSMCVYAGHLYEGRGIEDIIEAASILPETRFTIVGGWPRDVERYRDLSAHRGVTNVSFAGHVPNSKVPLYLFAADAVLMPHSARAHHADRTSPLKMFEYMAAGRPIIASGLPVLRTVLRDKENALLIEPDAPRALAEAITHLLSTPLFAAALGDKARQDAVKYSWRNRAERILDHVLGRE